MKVMNEKIINKIKKLGYVMKNGYQVKCDFTKDLYYVFYKDNWYEFDHPGKAFNFTKVISEF